MKSAPTVPSLFIHPFIFFCQVLLYCVIGYINYTELNVQGHWVLHTVGIQPLSADLSNIINSSHSRQVL